MKLQIISYLLFILLFFFQLTAFSIQLESKTALKNHTGSQLKAKKKSKSDIKKSDCNLSARSQKIIRNYQISKIDDFLNEQDIENLLERHLDDIKKGWPGKCPEYCTAVNNYSILAKTYPLSINKASCNKNEAKETYHLSKKFPFKSDSKADKQKAYQQTRDWVFSIFVDPYYPFAKAPPKEFTENKIGTACPSCSFYFDYIYKYTETNTLDLSITARCGDKRTFFSKFKSEFFLVNQWKCVEKTG